MYELSAPCIHGIKTLEVAAKRGGSGEREGKKTKVCSAQRRGLAKLGRESQTSGRITCHVKKIGRRNPKTRLK